MTVRLLVQCDGTPADRPGMALETCRAFYPTGVDVFARDHRRDTFREAGATGWTVDRDDARDLCPACSRHVRLQQLHDQRWPWCDRHDEHSHTDRIDGPPLVDGEPAGPLLELEDRQVHP